MALATFAPLRRLLPTLLARPIHVSAPLSGGAGMSVGSHIVPVEEIPESDELIWDDGSPNPEPCPDVVAPHISENGGLALLLGAMGFYTVVGTLAVLDNAAARVPWETREIEDDPFKSVT